MKSPNIKMIHKIMGIIWEHKRKKREGGRKRRMDEFCSI
jgi:hypothetical protein